MRGLPATGPDAPRWRLARFLRRTVAHWLIALFRVRVVGIENIPAGGAILAGNHVSYLDPALLWCVTPRPVHFMAKSELWGIGWLGWALDRLWAFPVNRGGADRQAITRATALLGTGELVGMFPEGTRKRSDSEEAEAHGGVAFIAARAGVPVVPTGIIGTERAWPAGKKFPRFVPVTIRFAEPVCSEDFEGGRKEKVSAMTSEIMRRVAEKVAEGEVR